MSTRNEFAILMFDLFKMFGRILYLFDLIIFQDHFYNPA